MKPDNPPAFACVIKNREFPNNSELERLPGMTLRDYLAEQALASYVSAYANGQNFPEPEHYADRCYAIADAMLIERSNTEKEKL